MWGDAARHRASVFWREHAAVPDAMILTAWRAPGCEQVMTEDSNHRHVLDGITIINPFVETAPRSGRKRLLVSPR